MDPGPEYQRARTRYEIRPGVAALTGRRVPTARRARVSPWQIITGVAGVVLLVLGLIAMAKHVATYN